MAHPRAMPSTRPIPATVVALLACSLSGCVLLDNGAMDLFVASAVPEGSEGELAVGARALVAPRDRCAGGGKLDLCSTEKPTELLSVTLDPTSALSLEAPAAGAMTFAITALKDGSGTVRARAMFEGGKERETSTEFKVRNVGFLTLTPRCDPGAEQGKADGATFGPWLLEAGAATRWAVVARASSFGRPLIISGLPTVAAAPPELATILYEEASSDALVTFPAGGSGKLESPVYEKAGTRVQAYSAAEVDSLQFASPTPLALGVGQRQTYTTRVTVGGRVACTSSSPIMFESQTPTTCTLLSGNKPDEWTIHAARELTVVAVSAGACTIKATHEGSGAQATLNLTING